jgi:predicted nucleic acid-binding protein
MILLDTNVVSEATRVQPDPRVREWLDEQSAQDLYLCTPVLAELRYGIERLPSGRKRSLLEETLSELEEQGFRDRILPLDRDAAHEFGRLVAKRERLGRPIKTMDALIAGIALVHRATIATRDVSDFEGLDLSLVNPFGPTPT